MEIEVQRYTTPCCQTVLFEREGVRSFFWDMRQHEQCQVCGSNQKTARAKNAQARRLDEEHVA